MQRHADHATTIALVHLAASLRLPDMTSLPARIPLLIALACALLPPALVAEPKPKSKPAFKTKTFEAAVRLDPQISP
jgi:hypothetical protein